MRITKLAKSVGYLALLVSIIAFTFVWLTDFATWSVVVSVSGLAVAFVILPIPIVLGYGIRAAEREERL